MRTDFDQMVGRTQLRHDPPALEFYDDLHLWNAGTDPNVRHEIHSAKFWGWMKEQAPARRNVEEDSTNDDELEVSTGPAAAQARQVSRH